ncbi:hypothetical protein MP638_005735 [Amoeboaphelidium occidentale]|nr:hypothetical protein MP638_005735 [Amoeboaphelidium occidentale]
MLVDPTQTLSERVTSSPLKLAAEPSKRKASRKFNNELKQDGVTIDDPLLDKTKIHEQGLDTLWYRVTPEDNQKFLWTNGIMYALMFPIYFLIGLVCTLCFPRKAPTDKEMINMICNSLLCLQVSEGTKSKYCLNFTKTFLHTRDGEPIDSMKVDFDDDQIVSCEVNGKPETDRSLIMGYLFVIHVGSNHTKVHVVSANLMKYFESIKERNDPEAYAVKQNLFPEVLNTTNKLHHTLLNSPCSPLSNERPWLLYYITSKEALLAETGNWTYFTHSGLNTMKNTKLIKFLERSRRVMREELHRIGLVHLTEPLFTHTVLHSLDHIEFGKQILPLQFSIGVKGTSLCDYIGAEIFKRQFVEPILFPFNTNFIKEGKSEFWKRLYSRLSELDAEWASEINCSIMY